MTKPLACVLRGLHETKMEIGTPSRSLAPGLLV